MYKKAYELGISPLNDRSMWEDIEYPIVLSPRSCRPQGRLKKKRIRGANEQQQQKRYDKCTRSHQFGHHKNTCKNSLPNPSSSRVRDLEEVTSSGTSSRPSRPPRFISLAHENRGGRPT